MNWLVDWGISCSQGGCKENQDGWFMVIPSCEENTESEKETNNEYLDHNQGFLRGVWNFDPIQQNIAKIGINDTENTLDTEKLQKESFPPVFPLFSLPPLQPRRNGPSWVSHTTGNRLITSKSIPFFGLSDGHGYYGKTASHMAAYCISQTLFNEIPNIPNCSTSEYIQKVMDILDQGYSYAHESILTANVSGRKDFGTTCIVVGIVDEYLVTANCGDSSAICIIPNLNRKNNSQKEKNICQFNKNINLPELPVPFSYDYITNESSNYHGIYYLSNPHCLNRKSERQRIDQSGVGKVVLGDFGMLRLIPSYLSYSQARDMGLSISMSRSLGHMHLSRCALLPIPDYRVLNIGINNFSKKKSQDSIKKFNQINKLDDEKMVSFSEALVEQSVIAVGWSNRTNLSSLNKSNIENVELDWSTDDDSFTNNNLKLDKDSNWDECFVVIMSDGVSDILDGFTIADIIVDFQHKSMEEIADILTNEAEKKRRLHNIRADNCTVIVIRIRNKNKNINDQQFKNTFINNNLTNNHINYNNNFNDNSNNSQSVLKRIQSNYYESSPVNRQFSNNDNKFSETPIRSIKPNSFSVHRSITPIQRRKKIATPSPARVKTCKLREIPTIFLKNQ